jgi:hypothetical protein
MDNETIFEKAIIQGDLKTVRQYVYTKGITVTKYHIQLAKTMRELCDPLVYNPIIEFLNQEYLPPIHLSWLQRLFSVDVDFTRLNF